MSNRKNIKQRGKIKLSEYFKDLKIGERVAVKREKSVVASFPERIQGLTGIIEGKRGRHCVVKLKEINKEKVFIIAPIHLKRIKTMEKIK